jgi:hypothetical protein
MEAPGWSPNADFIVYVIKVSGTETRMELLSETELLRWRSLARQVSTFELVCVGRLRLASCDFRVVF